MTQNYIGINGLVTQSLEEIRTDLTAKFKNIYGNDINLEQNSPDGQFINLLAQEKKDTLDLFTQFYNNLDPDRAIGIPQQILYKLNGLTINAYTYSYVYVDVTVTQSVTLPGLDENIENADGVGYTVRDINGNRWILANTTEIFAGSARLSFRAAELGAVTALPNTITVMETVLLGVSGVNNAGPNYITGNQGETSAQFRQRRNQAMAVAAQGFDDAIESQMLNIENVTQCKVYDNRSAEVVNDIPAHTVWVIVEGGTPDQIGRIIYNNLPPGIPMKGSQSVTITKTNGQLQVINYDLPEAIPLYVRATIKNFTNTELDENYIKQQIALLRFNIGELVESLVIQNEIKNTIGETGSPYNCEISLDNATWVDYLTPVGLNEYFSISTDNITLTVVDNNA